MSSPSKSSTSSENDSRWSPGWTPPEDVKHVKKRDFIYDLEELHDWFSFLDADKESVWKKGLRLESMMKWINKKSADRYEDIIPHSSYMLNGATNECDTLFLRYLDEKVKFVNTKYEKYIPTAHQKVEPFAMMCSEKGIICCPNCNQRICIYYETEEHVWEAIGGYFIEHGLTKLEDSDDIRAEHHKAIRYLAYKTFYEYTYGGKYNFRIQLPDCIEFRYKYWFDSAVYTGFRENKSNSPKFVQKSKKQKTTK